MLPTRVWRRWMIFHCYFGKRARDASGRLMRRLRGAISGKFGEYLHFILFDCRTMASAGGEEDCTIVAAAKEALQKPSAMIVV
jgi:hypothetical protein